MASAKKAGIVQFAGEGYDVWRFRVETQMSANGVKDALLKEAPETAAELAAFREMDEKAKALLVTYIADSHLEYVRDKGTAKAMWESLANTFSKKGFSAQNYIRRSLALLKMDEGTLLMDHFRRFDELVRQLKDAGATCSELDTVSQLFISLPPSYDVVTTAMENLPEDQLKLDMVKARLLAEEQKRTGRDVHSCVPEGSALASKSSRSKKPERGFKGKCFGCGFPGHKKQDCPGTKNRGARAQAASVPVDKEVALMVYSDTELRTEQEWILDSGASWHMANDKDNFWQLRKLNKSVTIDTAKDGEKLVAEMEGTVKMKVENNLTLSLGSVLLVPKLKYNLLSLSKLLEAGVQVKFEPGRAILAKDGEELAVAKMKGCLFYLKTEPVRNVSATVASNNDEALQLWHKRFNHLSFPNLKRLKRENMVHGIGKVEKEGGFCDTCAESKLVRQPFNKHRPATHRPLERVHTDVWGKITPRTVDGHEYFVSFIDDYTHFAVVYLMKQKCQVFEYFKDYEAMVTAKFGKKSRICDAIWVVSIFQPNN